MNRQIEYCAATLHRMWGEGASYAEIAAVLGCSESYVHRLKQRHKLANRQKPTQEILADDPTPAQIAERAAECRARRPDPGIVKTERFSIPRYSWNGRGFQTLG